ncbi:MAG: lamin tail domain-containing protein [Akkermansiaceae bacterium]|nr:lamin tail domain-containing protein [Akkermansiaceae bacterium]
MNWKLLINFKYLLAHIAIFSIPGALAGPIISEFMAVNNSVLADEDGDFSDWIEIRNPDASAISLAGYHLTDDVGDLTKWTFPAVNLNAGATLVVFASNKDRALPAGELHTNFKLSAGGEYLALVNPDGTTIESGFFPSYPPQFPDQSFGFGTPGSSTQVNITPTWSSPANFNNVKLNGVQSATLGSSFDNIDADLAGSQLLYYMWFDFSSQLGAITAGDVIDSATMTWSGVATASIFGSSGVTSELGVFPVPDANYGIDTVATTYNDNTLVNYYAANTPVDSYTAVPGQTPTATWNIKSFVEDWRDNPGDPQRGQLMIINSAHPMFMDWDNSGGAPTLNAVVNVSSDPNAPAPLVYFDTPTPNAANTGGQAAGPVFGTVTENPPQPTGGDLTVTAQISGSADPVSTVAVYYRLAFGGETQLAMADDGVAPDAAAGDGVYTANIPASALQNGEMTRWRFAATDTSGAQTKEPAFRDPVDSHQYFGTVQADPTITTNLNVLDWFIQNPSGATNTTGTTGAVYYKGEFYDNVHFNRHGQSTGGFIKKSYNLDFNKTQRFLWSDEAPRVADIDLLTNWADKSKVRHPLAWEIMRESGVNAHFAFTIRVEQNGQFFSTADFVEDGDDIYLERAGLNPNGAMYKVYGNRLNKDQGNTGYSGVEKKNRKSENNDDLQALIDGLDLTGAALENYMRDNIDIPKTINMLAANSVIRNIDMHSKNWYIYRDTGKTDEWAILPWDLDLSQGRVWNSQNTYFDNNVYTNGLVVTGNSIRLVSHLFNNSETRAMIHRRIRTLADEFLQPESTPLVDRWYERRLDEQAALIDDPLMAKSDAQRDFEKWGSWLQGNGSSVPYTTNNVAVESMAEAIVRWKNEYLPGRRNEIYNNQTVGNGGEIPDEQIGQASVTLTPLVQAGDTGYAFVPTDDSLGTTWQGAPANEPFSTAGWFSGPTGFGYDRGSGYESLIGTDVEAAMASSTTIYIRVPFNVTDPADFDSLELRMQWDDGFVAYLNGDFLFAANNPASVDYLSASNGNGPEANAGSFNIYDVTSKLGSLQAGQNILAIHGLNQSTGSSDFIIRPELYGGATSAPGGGHPALSFGTIEFSPASGNQDEEFVEITNPFSFAVDISEWEITGGIEHTFAPGTVIASGGSLYVSPDVNTFRARSVSPTGGEGRFIQGKYSGHLSSFPETLNLLDVDGNLLTTTTYLGDPSDAQLYLVVSEIMYHPDGDGLAEFIELTNISDAVTLDLTGVKFVQGVEFDFTGSAVTSLAPGARVLLVRDSAAFNAVHGGGNPVAGEFANLSRLNNDGETLKLEDALNGTIREFIYNDVAPWPVAADAGYSLVLVNPNANPDPDVAANWRSSVLPGGSPNASDAIPVPASPTGDSDGNGIADLVDYALGNGLGSAPMASSVSWQTYDIGGSPQSMLTMSYPVSIGADGVTVGVDASTDLANWQNAAANSEVVSEVNQGDGRKIMTVRFTPPIGASEKQFLRLRIEEN